jgi:transposase
MYERTFIGLDVHARSVKAGVLDDLTGEVNSLAVPVATQPLVAWVCAQPDPAVACEAGPTGYELARALDARGVQILDHAALLYSAG